MERTEKNGPAAAALLAAGIGCAVLGLITTLSELSPTLKRSLDWGDPAGPLAGKTAVSVLTWLIAWGFLHRKWRSTELARLPSVLRWAWILMALGGIGTFPPFFELFSK